jgi:hypothetical protein
VVPLVTSLAFGLMTSTLLVLLLVPTLDAILHDFGLSIIDRDEAAVVSAVTSPAHQGIR